MAWVKTTDAQRALGELMRQQAKQAADGNTLISRQEQKSLPEFLQNAADQVRQDKGAGARLKVDELVSKAMGNAMETWARFNPTDGSRDAKYLSRAEVKDIGRFDQTLGALTLQAREMAAANPTQPQPSRSVAVTMSSNHPDARLEQDGDIYRLISSRSDLGTAANATLHFDNQSIRIDAGRSGMLGLRRPMEMMPPGYWLTTLDYGSGEPRVQSFRLEKAHPNAISEGRALGVGRQALTEFIKNERMHQPDWISEMNLPRTWQGLVDEGILDDINRFGDEGSGGRVLDQGDHFTIVGRGPFGLPTEVGIDKISGDVKKMYVEID